jgi:hypothetical protein
MVSVAAVIKTVGSKTSQTNVTYTFTIVTSSTIASTSFIWVTPPSCLQLNPTGSANVVNSSYGSRFTTNLAAGTPFSFDIDGFTNP